MHNVAITYSVLLILQNSYDIQHSQSEEIETYLFLTYGYYFYINELSFRQQIKMQEPGSLQCRSLQNILHNYQ